MINNHEALEDIKMTWRCILNQKIALVCFKEGSDEIAGINGIYVISKDDSFFEKIGQRVYQSHSEAIFK